MNLLHKETSPYLLQHANNPIHWQAWNDYALAQAKEQNRLIVVSIGYAACHWCHVMEHESFEDEEVANLMNANYVSIKVDREERPDLDQVYMDAAYVLTGRGGWPLNVICLPDGRPVYAGTYFQKNQWLHLLGQLHEIWQNEPEKLLTQAAQIIDTASSFEVELTTPDTDQLSIDFTDLVDQWLDTIDWQFGGEKGAPKFPMPSNYSFLFAYGNNSPKKAGRAKEFSLFTVEQIVKGGIYDHIGGGFARYSVDEEWHVPHFEKMLYDNGQLLSLLVKSNQIEHNELIEKTIHETAHFLTRELRGSSGGFYSSYDADSEGEEGKFYVFSKEEIDALLGDDAPIFNSYFDVSTQGNWENVNVLRIVKSKHKICQEFNLSAEEFDSTIQKSKQKLFAYREQRVKPGLDDKILTSWNALAILGFCDAARLYPEKEYKTIALETANFLVENLMTEHGQLFRNYKNETASINGFLDDYSFTIEAFLAIYQLTFDEVWLKRAGLLIDYVFQHFLDQETNLFYYTSNQDPKLVLRKKEMSDNVIPASNSSMLKAIYLYGAITGDMEKQAFVQQGLLSLETTIQKSQRYYSNWLELALLVQNGLKEISIVGENCHQFREEMQKHYLPNVVYLGAKESSNLESLSMKIPENSETTLYLCENQVCLAPVSTVEEMFVFVRS